MRYFDNLINSQASCLRFVLHNEIRGSLWTVRYSLYRGGRRLIFGSDIFCVCGQDLILHGVPE